MKKGVLLELITIYKNYKSTNCYEKYENKIKVENGTLQKLMLIEKAGNDNISKNYQISKI